MQAQMFISSSIVLHPSSMNMSVKLNSLAIHQMKTILGYTKGGNGCILGFRPKNNRKFKILQAMNMAAAGQSDDPGKMNLDGIIKRARNMWENCPDEVKTFPWDRAVENFIQLILDLVLAVVKYLSVPLLAITTLSEMSYCAHERKLVLVPIPFVIGFTIAGILRTSVLKLSPHLKDAEVPWHLLVIAVFFTILKLPGPYYPYWGRIVIPHVANGALWGSLFFAFMWYKNSARRAETPRSDSSQSV
ncbi:uncharacterized protein LOC124931252 [Impatiens glandulifera]|uniref:uncharacterized protein LOC124931252 n=1 Tax=Impatiens glandulifera TaxID=253017 RepID=UPI001FB0C022|nr:uncharacterized protein LOC124931252 [Impatiens glandulifera]